MIDTVVLRFPAPLQSPGLGWHSTDAHYPNQQRTSQWYSYRDQYLNLTLKNEGKTGSHLWVQASLPKQEHEHNLVLPGTPDECRALLARLHQRVDELAPEIAVPPVEEWKVSRVDFSHDWPVRNTTAYVLSIAPAARKHKARGAALWRNPHAQGWSLTETGDGYKQMLYDKTAETQRLLEEWERLPERQPDAEWAADRLREFAQGHLRYEVGIRRAQNVGRVLRGEATVKNLLAHLEGEGLTYLAAQWERLTRNWNPMPTSEAIRRLREAYGDSGGYAAGKICGLADFYVHVSGVGLEAYQSLTGINQKTLNGKLARLKKAGLGLGTGTGLKRLTVPQFPGADSR